MGFPQSNRTTLRYAESVTISGAAGSMATYQFALNGLFDPNITGTGHQPLGFDQWSVFYNNYVVHSCRWRLTPFVTSASIYPYFGAYVTDDTSITATSAPVLIEQGKSEWTIVYYTPTLQYSKPMKGSLDMREWFQVAHLHDAIANYGAAVTSNPSNIAYLTLFVQDLGAAGTAAVRVLVELEFEAEFIEPKELPVS